MTMTWTDERITLLKRLWNDGLSASQIAGKIGEGVSRNAVIGKAHRLKLAGRSAAVCAERRGAPRSPVTPPRVFAVGARSRASVVAVAAAPAPTPTQMPRTGCADVLHLTERACKWPIGDPCTDGFHFCGARADGGPYCTIHKAQAYQAVGRRAPIRRRPFR